MILIADPEVLSIPIQESHEPLVDLRTQTEILIGPSPEIENNESYTWVRAGVAARLQKAHQLLPVGLRLCLYEGLRTISLQKFLFDQRWEKLKKAHPELSDTEIYHEAIKLVSPVITFDGTRNVPPHSTGAAVDVYLVDAATYAPIEMGILAKDWMLDTDGVISQTDSRAISEEAKRNRALLSAVMEKAGFANYPTEYWHWSYGDRYWALMKNQPHAIYGSMEDHS